MSVVSSAIKVWAMLCGASVVVAYGFWGSELIDKFLAMPMMLGFMLAALVVFVALASLAYRAKIEQLLNVEVALVIGIVTGLLLLPTAIFFPGASHGSIVVQLLLFSVFGWASAYCSRLRYERISSGVWSHHLRLVALFFFALVLGIREGTEVLSVGSISGLIAGVVGFVLNQRFVSNVTSRVERASDPQDS